MTLAPTMALLLRSHPSSLGRCVAHKRSEKVQFELGTEDGIKSEKLRAPRVVQATSKVELRWLGAQTTATRRYCSLPCRSMSPMRCVSRWSRLAGAVLDDDGSGGTTVCNTTCIFFRPCVAKHSLMSSLANERRYHTVGREDR